MINKNYSGVRHRSSLSQQLQQLLKMLILVTMLLPVATQAFGAAETVTTTKNVDGSTVTAETGITEARDKTLSPTVQAALPDTTATAATDNIDNPLVQTTPLPDQSATTQTTPVDALPHDLSPWGMFLAADWVVKAVMIGLTIASLLTWTVFIAKSIELNAIKRLLKRDLSHLNHSQTLADTSNVSGIGREFVEAAKTEFHLSADLADQPEGNAGIKERVASSLSRIEATSARSMLLGTGLLATIGAIGPFVGLLGTVWGIMNSFIGISQANTTNLAVVAPGIAEALLATAFGLVAAIPAVVIYNHFTRQIAGSKTLLADSAAAVMRLVSRDLDRGLQPLPKKVATQ